MLSSSLISTKSRVYNVWFAAAGVLALVFGLAMVGISRSHAQSITTVSMVNNAFVPQMITVPAGTIVTWINNDMHYHDVVAESGLFRSGVIYNGGTYSFTFTTPGTYYYYCEYHGSPRSGMWGSVTVTGGAGYYNNGYNNNYPYYNNYNSNYGNYYYPYNTSSYSYPYNSAYNNYSSYSYPYNSYSYSYPYSNSTYTTPYYYNNNNSNYSYPSVNTATYYPYNNSYSNNYSYNYPYYYPYQNQTSPYTFNLSCTYTGGQNYSCGYNPSYYTYY